MTNVCEVLEYIFRWCWSHVLWKGRQVLNACNPSHCARRKLYGIISLLPPLCKFWESNSQHSKPSIHRTVLLAPLFLIPTFRFCYFFGSNLSICRSLFLYPYVSNLSSLLVFYSFHTINFFHCFDYLLLTVSYRQPCPLSYQ